MREGARLPDARRADCKAFPGGAAVPGAPASPSPAAGATAASTSPTLTWTAGGATTFDVSLGTTNPPPAVASALTTASYQGTLTASTFSDGSIDQGVGTLAVGDSTGAFHLGQKRTQARQL